MENTLSTESEYCDFNKTQVIITLIFNYFLTLFQNISNNTLF